MAQQTEIAQLYYTLGARADASTATVLADQGNALDQLEEQAKAAGVPLGTLRAAVAQLVDEVEGELKAAVAKLGKEMDASGMSAAVLAKQTEAVAEASSASIGALSAQVRLYGQGAQLAGTRQQSLAQLAAIEQLLKGRLDQGNLSLEQRIRLEGALAQTQVTLVGALGRASGAVASTQGAVQTAGAAVQAFGAKWSGTALHVVTAASSIVQSGNISSGGLKSVLLGATSLAGFLGAGGALVVAAAVAANAIIGVFTKAREEAKQTADAVREEIARMQNAGDTAGLTQRAQTLFEGTAAGGYKDGIRALREQLAALDQQIASAGVFGQLDTKTKEERARIAETLKGLEEDFARTREAINNPATAARSGPLPIRTTTTSPDGDAERLKRAADATAQGAAAFRDVRQAVEDLVGSVQGGESVLAAFDRKVREIEDAFAKLKAPTAEQTAQFAQLRASAEAARQTLLSITGKQAAAELRKIEAALTPSILDEMAIATQELRDRLLELKAPPEVAQRILALQRAIDDATVSGKALDDRLEAIATSGAGPLRQMIALGEVRREKEAELLGITAKGEAADRRRATLKAQIVKIQGEEAKLANDQATAEARTVEHTSQLLSLVQDVASAAFGIATAFLGADATLTKMIGSAAQVASSIVRIGELAQKAGGLSKLFSSRAGIIDALPAIGGLLGGVAALGSQLFGREDPAAKALREALDRNAQKLEEFTTKVGELVHISIGGEKASGVRDIATTKRTEVTVPGQEEPVIRLVDLTSQELLRDLASVGVGLKDLQQIASDFGVTFADVNAPTAAELRQLQEFIRANSLKKLTDSLSGQLKLLELQARIDPGAFEGIAAVIKRIDVLTGEKGVPALQKALEGIDLSATDGPAQAIERLKQLLADFTAGNIDIATLGGLSPDAFVEAIASLIESIRAAAPALRSPAQKFKDALDAFGTAVELGSMTAEQKLAKAKALFAELFPDLAASVDTSSLESFKASIQSIIDGFAADGELTDAEKAQIEVLRLLLGAFGDASGAANDTAENVKQAAAEMRSLIFTLADAFLAVHDITDPLEILKVKAAALVQAFPALADVMAQFDLSTQEGRDALEAWIQSLIDSPDALKAMAEKLGISVDDLIAQLLGLESAADNAAAHVATLAEQISGAFDNVQFDINLEGITDPIEKLKRTVSGIAGIIPEIDKALAGLDLSTEAGRAAAEQRLVALGKTTTDTAVRNAILNLLGQLRGIPVATTPAASGGTAPGAEPTTTAQTGVQQITERTGLQMTELQRLNNRQNEAMIALLARIADGGAILDSTRLLRAPTLSALTQNVTNTGTVLQLRIQNTFTGPISAGDAAVVQAGITESVKAGLNKAFGTDLNDIRAFRGGWPT